MPKYPKKGKNGGRRRRRAPTGRSAPMATTERREARDLFAPHDFLRHVRRPELKHLDVNSSGYVNGVSYAGTVTVLTAIAQGSGGNQRVGDAISVRGIEFRIACYAQNSSEFLRVIVFQWNMPTSLAAPSTGVVIQGAGATPQTIAAPYDFTSVEQGRLNVIDDFVLQAAAGASTPAHSMKRHTGSWQVDFDPGATTASGQLYVLVISDAALATNAPVYQWWARILYDDL